MTPRAFTPDLLDRIRDRFAHVESCPITGSRVFFENAGGALTLNSVVETSARFAAIPDNQGRDNPASAHLMAIIAQAREQARDWMGATSGTVAIGESGTELLFRLIRAACLGAGPGRVLGSTIEHPASRSAAERWAARSDRPYHAIPHDDATGAVSAQAYSGAVTADTAVATILHTSPVTGMGMDLPAIAAAIRARAPDCFIIVDGIQHAAHGIADVEAAQVDGYVISPYKMFSRHGYGVAWLSERLAALDHDRLNGAPAATWELGTRDTGSYATFSDTIDYLDWLGGELAPDATTRRARLIAAGAGIGAHEAALTEAMIHGTGNLPGLAEMERVTIIGGIDNPAREGLVSISVEGLPAPDLVAALNDRGIRTHTRKADHYSGNVLDPLGLPSCARVSLAHYNSQSEVAQFLAAMAEILD